jgi:hypothetical protein
MVVAEPPSDEDNGVKDNSGGYPVTAGSGAEETSSISGAETEVVPDAPAKPVVVPVVPAAASPAPNAASAAAAAPVRAAAPARRGRPSLRAVIETRRAEAAGAPAPGTPDSAAAPARRATPPRLLVRSPSGRDITEISGNGGNSR